MGAVIINQAAILSHLTSSGEKRSKPTKELVYTIE
jgi:hypothetical protein